MNKEISWYKLMTFSSKHSNGPIHRKPEKKKKNILVKMKIADQSTRIRS